VKYSKAGAGVSVDLRPQPGDAELTVRNRGPGIAPEDQPHVFDRFYRGRATSAQRAPGSGLGLPIARWIVEKHEGTIGLHSADGLTEVRIRLPVCGSAGSREQHPNRRDRQRRSSPG
jgi:two-component system, OmpR family, sensor kinase